jgi:hypothetical protein
MFQIENSKGYDISYVSINEWIFNVRDDNPFIGSFADVVRYAIGIHGFKIKEIEKAIEAMLMFDHDSIHFGMFRTMIFTYNREEKKVA